MPINSRKLEFMMPDAYNLNLVYSTESNNGGNIEIGRKE